MCRILLQVHARHGQYLLELSKGHFIGKQHLSPVLWLPMLVCQCEFRAFLRFTSEMSGFLRGMQDLRPTFFRVRRRVLMVTCFLVRAFQRFLTFTVHNRRLSLTRVLSCARSGVLRMGGRPDDLLGVVEPVSWKSLIISLTAVFPQPSLLAMTRLESPFWWAYTMAPRFRGAHFIGGTKSHTKFTYSF